MKMPFLKLGFLVLVLAGLAACSSSNNLKDPTNGSAVVESSCDPSTAGCVAGQFVADEVVKGVSFTCTSSDQSVTVTSVTDDNGLFTCPAGAAATFYIGSAVSSKRIVLGTTTINPQALPSFNALSGTSTQTSGIVTVTPLSLVLGSTDLSTSGGAGNASVINIVRFLKALDSDSATWSRQDFSGFNPGNRIVIASGTSDLVDLMPASLLATEFTGSDLSPALQAFIDSVPGKDHTVDVPPIELAQKQLQDFLNGSFAGVYVSNGLPCATTDLLTDFGRSVFDQGMCNLSGGGSAGPKSGDLMLFVDRTGYGFGFGVTSQYSNISTPPVSPFYVEGLDNGKPAAGNPLTRPFAYDTGLLKLGAESQVVGGSVLPMSWTGLLRGGAIASTTSLYKLLYGVSLDTDVAGTLGVWTYGSADTPQSYVSGGQFFMHNAKPANLYLDGSVLNGDGLKFPINLELTFEYAPSSGTACTFPASDSGYCLMDTSPPSGSASYGPSGTLQVSILQNGNIVTNLNQDCNQLLDPTAATLVDTNQQTEYRIGFVSTVSNGVMPSDTTKTAVDQLSLTLLFPKAVANVLPTELQGVLSGIDASSLFKLPISGSNKFNVVLADKTPWYNYFDLISVINATTGTIGNAPHDFSSGVVLVKKRTNTDPVSGAQCSS
jgi:hypothetical protein